MAGQLSLFDDTDTQTSPFFGKRICTTGSFTRKKEFLEFLKKNGAIVISTASKNVDFIVVGENPNAKVLSIIEKLEINGFHIPRISVGDVSDILCGQWDKYKQTRETKKNLSLTFDHYCKFHAKMEEGVNPIVGKELFYGKGFAGDFQMFDQITGNLGAFGDNIAIYPDTNICVLSDATVSALKQGKKDETVLFIEDSYNKGKSITFTLSFLSESDILHFCE